MTHYMVHIYSIDGFCMHIGVYETYDNAIRYVSEMNPSEFKSITIEQVEGPIIDTEKDMNVREQLEDYAKRSDYWKGFNKEAITPAERYQDITEEFLGVEPKHPYEILSEIFDHQPLYLFRATNLKTLSEEVVDQSKHYPGVCPKCGSPAYIGIFKVDCSNPDCEK